MDHASRSTLLLLASSVAGCAISLLPADPEPHDANRSDSASATDSLVTDATVLDDRASPSDALVPRDVHVMPPSLLSPHSTFSVTERRPSLRFGLAEDTDSALIELCSDPACNRVEQSWVSGNAATRPPEALSPGPHFWRAFGRSGGVTGTVASSIWEFYVPHRDAMTDTVQLATTDFNADGYADRVVAAGNTPQGIRIGVFLGGPMGLSLAPGILNNPDPGGAAYASFAASMDAGDVNADGYSDLIVGAPASGYFAAVYVYFGGPSGLSTTPDVTLGGPSGGSDPPLGASYGLGRTVVFLGDFGGAGIGSFAVGAPGTSGSYPSDGRVYVLPGPLASHDTAGALLTLDSPIANDTLFGLALAGLGPTDPGLPASIMVLAGSPRGSLVRFEGPRGVPVDQVTNVDWDPRLVALGDIDGDRRNDLLMGSSAQPTLATLFLGSDRGPGATPGTPVAAPMDQGTLDLTSAAFAAPGDVDGDGLADTLCLARTTPDGAGVQTLYLFATHSAGATPLGVPLPTVRTDPGVDPREALRYIAGRGDIDGDGYADVVLIQQYGMGALPSVLVYHGGPGGLETEPAQVLSLGY